MTERDRDPRTGPHGDALDVPEQALLDTLRAAWRSLPAPEPTPDLELGDPTTRAVVGWLGTAWRALPAPALPSPAPRTRSAGGHLLRLRRLAAAALLLAGLGLALHLARRQADRPLVPATDRTRTAAAPADPDAPHVVALGPGRIESRSGPVRLVLLTASFDSGAPAPEHP